MKKMVSTLVLAGTIMVSGVGVAKADKASSINELFRVMQYENLLNNQKASIRQVLPQMLGMLRCSFPEFNNADASVVTKIFDDGTDMANVRKFTMGLYDKYYTEQEINELIVFYNSPVGMKTTRIMPQITQESMSFAMSEGQAIMTKVQGGVDNYLKTKGYKQTQDKAKLQSCLKTLMNPQ